MKKIFRGFVYLYHQAQQERALVKTFSDIRMENNVSIKGDFQNFKYGKNLLIQSNTVIHLGGMEWSAFQGSLIIGDNACLSPNTVIYAAGPYGVKIGDNFDCGPGVKIFASKTNVRDASVHDFGLVSIGNNVTLYANVVISPGVTIGDNVVIGANSVVTRDIPSNSLAIGNPCSVVKTDIRKPSEKS